MDLSAGGRACLTGSTGNGIAAGSHQKGSSTVSPGRRTGITSSVGAAGRQGDGQSGTVGTEPSTGTAFLGNAAGSIAGGQVRGTSRHTADVGVKTARSSSGLNYYQQRVFKLQHSASEWRPGGLSSSTGPDTTTEDAETVTCGAELLIAESKAHRALELHVQDAPPCTKGCISLSTDFGCTVSVRSFRSYRPAVINNVLMDTGGQISAVSEATLTRLLRENAVDDSDVIQLEAPHYVQGWDKQQPPKAINRMVLLRVIPEAPDGREPAQFEHGFLILPHLSKAMIIGRDVINRHGYRMSSNGVDSAGSVLELGTMDESQLHDRLAQQAQSVQLIEAVDSTCGWQLIAVESVAMRADQDTHVLVRVVSFNGAPVLDADDKDIVVEIRHAALHPTTIVVGAGVMTVVLRAAGSDFTLESGAILGEASRTAAVADDVHTPSESTLMRAMDLSCGAGGFTHGVAGQLNVVLGGDRCEAALQVYAANHSSAGCIQADVHLPADRDAIVRAATALQVQVVIGSTQTADSQYSTAEASTVRAWIDTLAAVSCAKLGVLSCSAGLRNLDAELDSLQAHAAGVAFKAHSLYIAAQDCGLSMRTGRTILVLLRALQSETLEIQQVMSELARLERDTRGKLGLKSVRQACAHHRGSNRQSNSRYNWPGSEAGAQSVCSTSDPMPSPALAAFVQRRVRSQADSSSLSLSWADLKAVASFDSGYVWSQQSGADQQAHVALLAEAVPPKLAAHVWQLLTDSGVTQLTDSRSTAAAQINTLDAESHQHELEAALGQSVAASLAEEAEGAVHLKSLADYISDDPEVNEILEEMRRTLPAHLLQLQLDLQGWSATHVLRLGVLLQYRQSVFSTDKWDIGHCDALPFNIELRADARPCTARPYRYSPAMTRLVKVEIDRLLAAGIIRPSLSEWSLPVVAV